jgi:predicted nucleic acid-binding protein
MTITSTAPPRSGREGSRTWARPASGRRAARPRALRPLRRPRGAGLRVVYADSGAFIALLWRRDRAHARIRDHYTALREAGDVLLTSDLVVSETATRLRFDAGLDAALAFRGLLEEAVEAGRLIVRHADAELDARAWDLMARYPGLTLSFTDCVGAVTAAEGRAAAVFGLDNDFRVLGFALEP